MATTIGWTQETWNPTVGCSKISEGCRNCYAERLSLKYGWTPLPWTANNADKNVQLKPERLDKPYSWKEPKMVFANSMSDLFHELISFDYVDEVFKVIQNTPQHTYQILTKRPERMKEYAESREILGNVWLGTSIEEKRWLSRMEILKQTPAHIRFLSLEPLLEPLGEMDLTGIHWVIVGGESGSGYRPMYHGWAREIRDQCVEQEVAFFFKQSAAFRPETGKALIEEDGSKTIWEYYPDSDKPHNFSYQSPLKLV